MPTFAGGHGGNDKQPGLEAVAEIGTSVLHNAVSGHGRMSRQGVAFPAD
jgi:hypothetical protein